EQQRYEKHLAEKFQQLPVPDVEPNWQQMKSLLDKEMPRGGGYWRWITGAGILLLMLGGTWLISRQDTGSIAGTKPGKQTEAAKKDVSEESPLARSSDKTVPNKEKTVADFESATDKNSVVDKNTNQLSNETKTQNIEETLRSNDRSKTSNTGSRLTDKTKSGTKDLYLSKDAAQRQKSNPGSRDDRRHNVRSGSNEIAVSSESSKGSGVIAGQSANLTKDLSLKNSVPRYELQNTPSEFEVNKLAGETIKQNYSDLLAKKNAENLKEQKSTSKTKTVKSKALAAVENRTVAIGLSLPLGFPLGDQKPGPYNINAKPNTVSDFLPVPHLQYHLNNKVYLQTELQIANPQFIQPVLLFQNRTLYPTTNTEHSSSVYAKKLYYFNIPVGIHYSPFEHFYLGTGLQFSSLLSGVAMQEETSSVIGSGTTNMLSQQYTKFKNDSISNMIDNSEFRLMLDANYYWKQFTVGLRYNQALSNYVSFKLNNATPYFQDKNKSLQFYLRYNLWETYKKR
ncbi:MAG TPA: hypothetical protein VKA49_21015, partial [Flavitalea sp.]|nr:hypothetical protein [Flavitalea sp.]